MEQEINSPVKSSDFSRFPILLKFLGQNPIKLDTNKLKLLLNYFDLNIQATKKEMLHQLYIFCSTHDLKEVIKDSRKEVPSFCFLNQVFEPPSPPEDPSQGPDLAAELGLAKKRKKDDSANKSPKKQKTEIQNIDSIVEEVKKKTEETETKIRNIELTTPLEGDVEHSNSSIAASFLEDKTLHIMLGVRPSVFYRLSLELEANYTKRRGPDPQISLKDSLFLLLHLYHTGDSLYLISNRFKVKKTTLLAAFKRARALLKEILDKKWLSKLPRPKRIPERGEALANVGLIVGTTSVRILKPIGRFAESKKFYDKKNDIYALKVEIAIQSYAPYYALFISEPFPGATHDFLIYQNNINTYANYLKVTKEDLEYNPDLNFEYFSLVADEGYSEEAKGPFEKITPKFLHRSEQTNAQIFQQIEYMACFLGRLTRLFKMLTDYRFDHLNFPVDITNCILLVNEELETGDPLNVEDKEYLDKYLQLLKEKKDEVTLKRRKAYLKTLEKKTLNASLGPSNESFGMEEDTVEDEGSPQN